MTTDLGFAWLKLPSGREVSIIDIPGHERFVKNMLAGAGGIDFALLIVAADEGVMPQTREHLAILDLLQVKGGVVAITKKDLVGEEELELATMEVEELVKGTTLAQAPILAVSAVTGEGLPQLVSAIDNLLDSALPKKDIGRPRLSIDRVFTMAGSGTVVTGTLMDGCFSLGQTVEVLPSGLKARIRGLQTHKRRIDTAMPGSRVAINLAGIAMHELNRGNLVTTPGWLIPSKTLDVKLRLLPNFPRPLTHNASVTLYAGASQVGGKVRLLDKEKLMPGETGWAQLVTAQPAMVVKGDRFILRRSEETIGGGEVVDPLAKRHRRFHQATLESLMARGEGVLQESLVATLESKGPMELVKLQAYCNLSSSEAKMVVRDLALKKQVVMLGDNETSLLFSARGWERLVEKTKAMVQDYGKRFPLRPGMPGQELRNRLNLSSHAFAPCLQLLLQTDVLVEDKGTLRLPSFQIQLAPEQQAAIKSFLDSLARHPYSPPSELTLDRELLGLLIEQRQVVKVSDSVVFPTSAYEEMVGLVTSHIKSQGKITLAEVRDLLGTSRKYAQALMEHLDARGVTRRIGDERVLK
ncbi:MAG: selenocysteine-specific translation elongation factor [Dehalococcoidia bacterium]